MHDKENDNCVRESCTQYVILRVLHPPLANLHDIRQDMNNCMETQQPVDQDCTLILFGVHAQVSFFIVLQFLFVV